MSPIIPKLIIIGTRQLPRQHALRITITYPRLIVVAGASWAKPKSQASCLSDAFVASRCSSLAASSLLAIYHRPLLGLAGSGLGV
jgi:hypothetical protein